GSSATGLRSGQRARVSGIWKGRLYGRRVQDRIRRAGKGQEQHHGADLDSCPRVADRSPYVDSADFVFRAAQATADDVADCSAAATTAATTTATRNRPCARGPEGRSN